MLMCIIIDQKNNKLNKLTNFSAIFSSNPRGYKVKSEKLACISHYFKRVLNDVVVTNHDIVFQRLVYNQRIHGKCTLEAWKGCNEKLKDIQVKLKGDIADELETFEVDFANKLVGGQSLGIDASREQILFITSPELLVGLLLFEHMTDNEAILIRGAEKYCASKGYGEGFTFTTNFTDKHPITEDNIKDREILAIDALDYRGPSTKREFSTEAILRELKKAYVGFFGNNYNIKVSKKKRIATGKWGCGAFKGHPQLKFLLQWFAASRAGRDTLFYLFDEEKDLDGVERIIHHYKGKTVGELFTDMLNQIDFMEKAENFLHLLETTITEKKKKFNSNKPLEDHLNYVESSIDPIQNYLAEKNKESGSNKLLNDHLNYVESSIDPIQNYLGENNKESGSNKPLGDCLNHAESSLINPIQNSLAEKEQELSSTKLLDDCLNYVESTTIEPLQSYLEKGPQQIFLDKFYKQVESDLLTNVKNCLEDFQTTDTSFGLCLAFRNLFHHSPFANLFKETSSLLSFNFAEVLAQALPGYVLSNKKKCPPPNSLSKKSTKTLSAEII